MISARSTAIIRGRRATGHMTGERCGRAFGRGCCPALALAGASASTIAASSPKPFGNCVAIELDVKLLHSDRCAIRRRRWCGRGGTARCPPIPIFGASLPLAHVATTDRSCLIPGLAEVRTRTSMQDVLRTLHPALLRWRTPPSSTRTRNRRRDEDGSPAAMADAKLFKLLPGIAVRVQLSVYALARSNTDRKLVLKQRWGAPR